MVHWVVWTDPDQLDLWPGDVVMTIGGRILARMGQDGKLTRYA